MIRAHPLFDLARPVDRILTALGVERGRIEVPPALDLDHPVVTEISRRYGYAAVDLARVGPDHPDPAAARAKFLAEHVHDDDETRWFVEGTGVFWVRADDAVVAIPCGEGDWIRLPAGVRHWFDMGPRPAFAAVRWFTRPDGWVARFTGDPLAGRFVEGA